MALWKEPVKSPSSPLPDLPDLAPPDNPKPVATKPAPPEITSFAPSPAPARTTASESHIAPELVIEGKINGAGHVRIAGRFKGDINVKGDLTIEHGARVEGSVHAERVTVAGELVGNIDSALHVELLQSGALTGDVKSASFSVAKGSKMRGQAEFGWNGDKPAVANIHKDGFTRSNEK